MSSNMNGMLYNNMQPSHPHHRQHVPPPPQLSVPPRLHPQSVQYATSIPPAPYMPPNTSIPSPSSNGKPREEDLSARPGPPPKSTIYDGKVWALEVVQQPIRARMCGFGDKDRRPITPPPCVRLLVIDPTTSKEINPKPSLIDTSFFVLTVDLWDVDAAKEVNLVKHAASSPSISTAGTSSYPPTAISSSPSQSKPQPYSHQNIPQYQGQIYAPEPPNQPTPTSAHYAANGYGYQTVAPGHGRPLQPMFPGYPGYGQQQHYQTSNNYPHPMQQSPTHHSPQNGMASSNSHHQHQQSPSAPSGPTGMFTRNLIGSLSASAFKLADTKDDMGIWFILQDLSVRTEGWFRLKFNFVNVGRAAANPPINPSSGTPGLVPQEINKTTAPVLASVFSRPFQVFSAKKFPGVIESTELSRAFAAQGIKIPIRKDPQPAGRGGRRRHSDDEQDLEEDNGDEYPE